MTTIETTDTPPAVPSNAPAPPRRFGLVARIVRHWLGIADQRHDFNALAITLNAKDQTAESDRQRLLWLGKLVSQIAPQLDRTTAGVISLTDRLTWHEQRVPALAGSKKAYDLALKRERARREQLIEQHPEWTEEQRQSVRGTGQLPPEKAPAPAEESSA